MLIVHLHALDVVSQHREVPVMEVFLSHFESGHFIIGSVYVDFLVSEVRSALEFLICTRDQRYQLTCKD